MSVIVGAVETFPDAQADKAQAVKVLEEAAEVFGAWQQWNVTGRTVDQEQVICECADVVQAMSNLLAAMGVVDMSHYIEICRRKNVIRGRFGVDE